MTDPQTAAETAYFGVPTYFDLEVTWRGKTRTVTFKDWFSKGERASNDNAFACMIGRGQKVYQANIMAWRAEDPKPWQGRPDYPLVTDADGRQWAVNLTGTTVRNRQAHLVGWAEDFFGTPAATAYDDYSTLKGEGTEG